MKTATFIILAIVLILSGVAHLFYAEYYAAMIPEFIPKTLANILVGIIELVIGVGFLLKNYQKKAAMAFTVLMIVFLPIHIWDATKEVPAIGSPVIAYVRIGFQFFLIYTGYWLAKK
jgi:uncharacterized membrane protein